MVGHKGAKIAQKTAQPLTAEKENLPPKKARRTISVSTLFEQQNKMKRKANREAYDILAPKPAGVFKHYAATRHSKGHENPVFRRFQGTTKAYRDGIGKGNGERLEQVYHELIARVDGLAVNGSSLDPKDAESGVEIEALAAEHARLASALSEDKIQIERARADGSTVAEERKLSDTMKAFEQVLDQKHDELDQFLRELKNVDAEIIALKQDIIDVEQKEGKKLKRSLDAQSAALVKKAEASNEATLADVEKARKEEEKATQVQRQRFEEFMNSI